MHRFCQKFHCCQVPARLSGPVQSEKVRPLQEKLGRKINPGRQQHFEQREWRTDAGDLWKMASLPSWSTWSPESTNGFGWSCGVSISGICEHAQN
jgi:hypothetical protein